LLKDNSNEIRLDQFDQFVLPHLSRVRCGPAPTLESHKTFNYILQLLHMECQWKSLPIEKNDGRPEIHCTRIYRAVRRWQAAGCMDAIFAGSVNQLHQDRWCDLTVIHGDGTHLKRDKVAAFCDRHCNVIAPCSRSGPPRKNTVLKTPNLTSIAPYKLIVHASQPTYVPFLCFMSQSLQPPGNQVNAVTIVKRRTLKYLSSRASADASLS
jgi:hypothetical protein